MSQVHIYRGEKYCNALDYHFEEQQKENKMQRKSVKTSRKCPQITMHVERKQRQERGGGILHATFESCFLNNNHDK